MVVDQLDVLGLAIRCQAHDLVFTGIDLESGVISESGIDQTERIGPAHLPKKLYVRPVAQSVGRGGPFADAVNREYRRLVERRWIKCTRGVRLVMRGVEDISLV